MYKKSIILLSGMILSSLVSCGRSDDKTLTGLDIGLSKNEFIVGDTITNDDLTVNAIYKDKSKSVITSGYTVNPSLPYTFKEDEFNKDLEFKVTYQTQLSSFKVHVTNQFTVKFVTTDYGPEIPDQVIKYNEKVSKPDTPVSPEYEKDLTFLGWYQDYEFTKPWDFDKDVVTSNMNLFAKYKFNGVGVYFVKDIDSKDADFEYHLVGDSLNKPKTPEKTGYTSTDKWYKDSSCKEEWNFYNDKLPEDAAGNYFYIFAGWTVNTYTVTFDVQGHGEAPSSQKINYKEKINKPEEDPTDYNYTFSGWYKEKDCKNIWDFETDTMPAEDITLYAKWVDYVSFFADTWEHVIKYANEGIDKLHEVYKNDCLYNEDYPNTLIGCIKYVQFSQNEYHLVRVIDENHDILSKDTSKKAALTLEFLTLVSSSKDGKYIPVSWEKDATKDVSWEDSHIRDYLNVTLKSYMQSEIRKGVKQVKKDTYNFKESKVKTYDEYFFPFCVSELGYKDEEYAKETSSVYKLYEKCTEQKVFARAKCDTKVNAHAYWLRSSILVDGDGIHAWTCNESGVLEHEKVIDGETAVERAVAPAFCI